MVTASSPGIDLVGQQLHQLSPVVVAAALGAGLKVVEPLLVQGILKEGAHEAQHEAALVVREAPELRTRWRSIWESSPCRVLTLYITIYIIYII